MQRILRHLLPVTVLLSVTAGLVACGGGGDAVSAGTNVDTLLTKTFEGDKNVKSGKFDLHLKVNVSGGGSGVEGPVDIRLSGPFESQGDTKLPKFDFAVEVKGAGQNIKAGAMSTGDKGFVSFNGQDYAVSGELFKQFKQGFEQAAAQGQKDGKQQSLKDFGINPKRWLTDPKNAGEEKVGDAEVVRITGGVDIAALLDDVNTMLGKAGSLGVPSQEIPSKLTDKQKQQVRDAVKDVKVEIYTGKEDAILRRMLVTLSAVDPEGSDGKADVSFDLKITDVNKGQSFAEPKNAKPFDQLLGQFGALGMLGGALGAAGDGGGGSGSGSGGGASQETIQKYSECLQDAGQDVAKAQKCAELLTP